MDGETERLVGLPTAEVQARFVGSSGDEAMAEAGAFWADIKDRLVLGDVVRGLDVGVGWGRIYRTLLSDVPDLIGVDVDPEAVAMCREAMPHGRFDLIEDGRIPLDMNSRNLAVVYSVYSHLCEAAFKQSIAEMARVISPGGYLAFTTLHDAHLDVWQSQLAEGNPWRVPLLRKVGFDRDAWRKRLAEGEFAYVPTGGGGMLGQDWYGEAIITPMYLARFLPESGFHLVFYDGTWRFPQAHVILRRDF